MSRRSAALGELVGGAIVPATRGLQVCLVRPPAITAPRTLSYYGAVPDLGLAYVAAAARAGGHRVTVVDAPGAAIERSWVWSTGVGSLRARGLTLAEIADRVPADADVVGIAHMFLHEWPMLRALVAAIRRARPRAFVIAGGENATAMWKLLLDSVPGLDAVVRGEGELALQHLLARLAEGGSIAELPSLALRRGGVAHANPSWPRLRELDAWPWPAWDLFPVASYLDRGYGSGVDLGRAMPILTSRGCPYQCTFCSSPQMWTTRYVRRDPERVLDEVEHLVAEHRVENVNINDLTALLTKEWILELCDAIERRGLRFTWQLPSGTRSEAIDREAAERMFAAGCRNFCYAPESGSEPELARMRKRVVPPRLLSSLEGAVSAGMITHASIMIGTPGQRGRDVVATARFVAKLARAGLHTLSVLVFAPYPGSALYEQLAATGRLQHDERWIYGSLLRSAGGARSHHERWSMRRLLALQLGLLGGFFALQYLRRPQRLARTLVLVARGRQRTVLEQLLAAKAAQLRADLAARRASALAHASRWLGGSSSALTRVLSRIASRQR